MKHTFICLIAITTLACSPKPDLAEQRMKRHFIADQLRLNQSISNRIIEDGGNSQRPSILAALKRNKIVSSLRDEYFARPTVNGLITYANAISSGYDTLSEKDERISEAIKNYQEKVLNGGDSATIENLYWHILYAESAMLDKYLQEAGSVERFSTFVSTKMNDTTFIAGDTVLVLFETARIAAPWKMDFSQIHCTNQEAGSKLLPKIIKIEDYYLLEYHPKEKGKYLIRGLLSFEVGDFGDKLPLGNDFTVH